MQPRFCINRACMHIDRASSVEKKEKKNDDDSIIKFSVSIRDKIWRIVVIEYPIGKEQRDLSVPDRVTGKNQSKAARNKSEKQRGKCGVFQKHRSIE